MLGFSNDLDSFQNKDEVITALVHLAYYAAQEEYRLRFEEGTGKGIADCLMLPRKRGILGIILELRYNRSAEEAIAQIRQKNYAQEVLQYTDKVLLVGINYDKETKKHQCIIEKL